PLAGKVPGRATGPLETALYPHEGEAGPGTRRSGHADVDPFDRTAGGKVRPRRRPGSQGDPAHPAPFVRHRPPLEWCRPSGGPGITGTCQPEHDPDLHARYESPAPRRAPKVS